MLHPHFAETNLSQEKTGFFCKCAARNRKQWPIEEESLLQVAGTNVHAAVLQH